MPIDMYLYDKLTSITGMDYNFIGHKDDDKIIITNIEEALEDMITEYEVLQEKLEDAEQHIHELEDNKPSDPDEYDKWHDRQLTGE